MLCSAQRAQRSRIACIWQPARRIMFMLNKEKSSVLEMFRQEILPCLISRYAFGCQKKMRTLKQPYRNVSTF